MSTHCNSVSGSVLAGIPALSYPSRAFDILVYGTSATETVLCLLSHQADLSIPFLFHRSHQFTRLVPRGCFFFFFMVDPLIEVSNRLGTSEASAHVFHMMRILAGTSPR